MAAAPDEAQLKQAFAAELHSIKSDLQALKSKFYDRQASRQKLHEAAAFLQGLGPAVDPGNPLEPVAVQERTQLVAAELLAPACTLPIPADALHKKVPVSFGLRCTFKHCNSCQHKVMRVLTVPAALAVHCSKHACWRIRQMQPQAEVL
eukprot:GHRQ01012071.1.p1 GENE.GHRQ01012071.1~~GHRQ01012071.1.p1  ORF type:complete len:149 (+),score=46.17 GHRQ01012071.1:926-1372(+)